MAEDYSLARLAELNLKPHLGPNEHVVAATVPTELPRGIREFSRVQAAATDSGELLLVWYGTNGQKIVTRLNFDLRILDERLYPYRPVLMLGLPALLAGGLAVALMGGGAQALVGTLCGLMAPGAMIMARELWGVWVNPRR